MRAGAPPPRVDPTRRCYWGGYTRKGALLHFAITSTQYGFARSACGRMLTGGSWVFGEDNDSKTCETCARLESLYAE